MTQVQPPQMGQSHANIWKYHLAFLAVYLGAVFALFLQTFSAMFNTWSQDSTYAHGYLIFPICAWLIWQKREILLRHAPRLSYPAVLGLLVLSATWYISDKVDVLVVAEFAAVAMLVVGCFFFIGPEAFRILVFPLLFIFFSVPVGADLVKPLMEFTATFTVWAVKMSGVPVYREGLYFYLPSGSWSVVEACSGIRYLIASVTLGTLFAYLTYSSLRKRVLFVILSVLLPIVANGIRAYLIVMIGHLSNMKLATGVDHLIYGWVFFGFVMFVLFAIGSRWKDEIPRADTLQSKTELIAVSPPAVISLLIACSIAIASACSLPLLAAVIQGEQSVYQEFRQPRFENVSGWTLTDDLASLSWQPIDDGALVTMTARYSKELQELFLHSASYSSTNRSGEMINSENKLIGNDNWRVVSEESVPIETAIGLVNLQESVIMSRAQGSFVIWSWYVLDGEIALNTYYIKYLEAVAALFNRELVGSRLMIAVPMADGNLDLARTDLHEFLLGFLSLQSAISNHAPRGITGER